MSDRAENCGGKPKLIVIGDVSSPRRNRVIDMIVDEWEAAGYEVKRISIEDMNVQCGEKPPVMTIFNELSSLPRGFWEEYPAPTGNTVIETDGGLDAESD